MTLTPAFLNTSIVAVSPFRSWVDVGRCPLVKTMSEVRSTKITATGFFFARVTNFSAVDRQVVVHAVEGLCTARCAGVHPGNQFIATRRPLAVRAGTRADAHIGACESP